VQPQVQAGVGLLCNPLHRSPSTPHLTLALLLAEPMAYGGTEAPCNPVPWAPAQQAAARTAKRQV